MKGAVLNACANAWLTCRAGKLSICRHLTGG